MKQKAQDFISKLQSVLDQDLKHLQIEVVVSKIEGDHPDSLNAVEVRDRAKKLNEINIHRRLNQKSEVLRCLREMPEKYLMKSQKALREKVLNGENIADLSSFEEAVEGFRTATSDAEIMSAIEKANWAVTEIINTEFKYGPLQGKINELYRDFKSSVEIKEEKKTFLHPLVMRKVAELTVNNANKVNSQKNASNQEIDTALQQGIDIHKALKELEKKLKALDEEFKEEINEFLNIPAAKQEEVTSSKEYKHFMNLCLALRDRMKNDLAEQEYEKLFSDEEKERRRMAYEIIIRDFPRHAQEEHEKFQAQETIINILEYLHKFKKFFDAIWKSLLELVDKFGLLPETTQVKNLKNSGQEWQKFVAERGSEVVKNHGLTPLN